MTKTAIIYARSSSIQQAENGMSVDKQIEEARRMAVELGASVLNVYRDDGVSAQTDSRPAFQSAIAYCDEFEVDFFICWSTSRFARNKFDADTYKKTISDCGTTIVYVSADKGWLAELII